MHPRPHNSPLEPHFSFPTKKVRFWLIKVVDRGTFTNKFPRKHVFSTNCDLFLTFQNPQLRNKCNRRPAVSHVLWWDRDWTTQNLSLEGARRLPLLFSQPIYRETWGLYLHFASLDAEKNINMLPTLNNLVQGVLLLCICKCAFRLCPTQCVPNMFRILSSVDALNEKLGIDLTPYDVNWVYSCQKGVDKGYYLKTRVPVVRLISRLLETNKGMDKDFLIVSGEWHDRWNSRWDGLGTLKISMLA